MKDRPGDSGPEATEVLRGIEFFRLQRLSATHRNDIIASKSLRRWGVSCFRAGALMLLTPVLSSLKQPQPVLWAAVLAVTGLVLMVGGAALQVQADVRKLSADDAKRLIERLYENGAM